MLFMRCFICLVSSLLKSLIAIALVCLLGASSCPAEKQEFETLHPRWSELNEPENELPKDKCVVTKLGLHKLRFHVTDDQQALHANDAALKSNDNIVQTDIRAINWVLTPHFYGSVTPEKFPQTMDCGMKYRFDSDDKEAGIPLPFLAEWLAVDPIEGYNKAIILIISEGIEGKLGVSESLRKALESKKEKGEIQDYKILNTRHAVVQHNRYVKEGKKVFTFIHTAG